MGMVVKSKPYRCNCGHSSYSPTQSAARGEARPYNSLLPFVRKYREGPLEPLRHSPQQFSRKRGGANEHHNYFEWETLLGCRLDCSIFHSGHRSDGTARDQFYPSNERDHVPTV